MAAFAPVLHPLGVGVILGGLAVVGMLTAYVYLRTRASAMRKDLRTERVWWRLAAETGLVTGAAAGVGWILMFTSSGWDRVLFSLPALQVESWLLPLRLAALALLLVVGAYVDWRLTRVLGWKQPTAWQEGAEIVGLVVAISGILLGFGTLAVEALG